MPHRFLSLVSRFGVFLAFALHCGIPLLGQGNPTLEERAEGLRLARRHCVTCHLFPDPSAVDLKTWHDEVLPRMKYRLGFSSPELERSTNIQILRENHRIPLKPVLTEQEWMTLSAFYFAEAPRTPRAQPPHEPISLGGTPFEVVVPAFRITNQSVCAVAIRPDLHEVWIGDDRAKALHRLSAEGVLVQSVPLENSPSRIRFSGTDAWIAGIGQLPPNDLMAGILFRLPLSGSPEPVLRSLRRPVDMASGDFDGDSKLEWIVAEFGNNIGALSRHVPEGGGWRREVVRPLPGTVRVEVADYDRDGKLDFTALISQETESFLQFLGDGKGGFRQRTLLQRPPQWGHSHFESVDMDGDGIREFLVSNGDNGEYNSPPKPYHGIRLYSQTPDGLEEKWFYPLNGAYGAHAADFDGDGDLDLVAISYFPDYATNPRESFVHFENLGGWRFRPSTVKECIAGHWMVMDSGDLDGDGDLDVVLGSYIRGPNPVPEFLMRMWDSSRIPILILRNRTR